MNYLFSDLKSMLWIASEQSKVAPDIKFISNSIYSIGTIFIIALLLSCCCNNINFELRSFFDRFVYNFSSDVTVNWGKFSICCNYFFVVLMAIIPNFWTASWNFCMRVTFLRCCLKISIRYSLVDGFICLCSSYWTFLMTGSAFWALSSSSWISACERCASDSVWITMSLKMMFAVETIL